MASKKQIHTPLKLRPPEQITGDSFKHFHSQGPGFNPCWGTKTAQRGKKKKKIHCCIAEAKPHLLTQRAALHSSKFSPGLERLMLRWFQDPK